MSGWQDNETLFVAVIMLVNAYKPVVSIALLWLTWAGIALFATFVLGCAAPQGTSRGVSGGAAIPSVLPSAMHIVLVPQSGVRSGLDAVSAVGSDDVWAVGAYQNVRTSSDLTEALHWDGRKWAYVPTPNVGAGWNHFFGVSGSGHDDVWSVGTAVPSNRGWPDLRFRTLAEHWDGHAWRIVPTPNVGDGANTLYAVAALGPDDAWAVGGYYDGPVSFMNLQYEHTAHTLVEHWDGRNWDVVASPDPGTDASFRQLSGPDHTLTLVNTLSAVAAADPADVWVAGHYWNGTANRTLILHWDGHAWHVVTSANASAGENVLYGVVALSRNEAWAVGTALVAPGTYHSLTERWDGNRWRVVASPAGAGSSSLLIGVAAKSPTDIWSVGQQEDGPLVLHWNGSRWRQVASQRANPGGNSVFNGVAVAGGQVCAVGESKGADMHRSLVEAVADQP